MSLTALASNVLGQIANDDGIVLLNLWKCGSHLLNCKLQQGCTRVVLRDLRLYDTDSRPARVPNILYQLKHLQHLVIQCPTRQIDRFDVTHAFVELLTLKIKCRSLHTLVDLIAFNVVYPSLTKLSLMRTQFAKYWVDTQSFVHRNEQLLAAFAFDPRHAQNESY